MELKTLTRRCHMSRTLSTRVILVSVVIIWVVIFNMLTIRRTSPGDARMSDRASVVPPAGWEAQRQVVPQQRVVEQVVVQEQRVQEQRVQEQRVEQRASMPPPPPPPLKTKQLSPRNPNVFSCFSDASKPEHRNFSASEKAMFRYVFDWPEVTTSSCKRMFKMGGVSSGPGCLTDGDKYVCLDEPLSLAAAHDDCLIYSFGINYDWSFDEAAEAFGCEVHSFDPSIDYPEGKRSAGITFHHYGIGRNNHTNIYGWQIYTLDQIIDLLGHRGRTIHYLKMDAEGGEFDMMAQQLLDGGGEFVLDKVEQIGFEVHYRLDPRLQMQDFYLIVNETVHGMRELGYNMVMWEYNKVVMERYMFPGMDRPVSLLYEILLIKNGPDTWDRSSRGRHQREAEAAAKAQTEAADRRR